MSKAAIDEIDGKGNFIRQENQFSPAFGTGLGELPVAANTYRLLWSKACPWAHRSVIVRKLLGLDKVISLGTASPLRPQLGRVDWAFTLDEGEQDPVLGIRYLSEAYLKADKEYQKRPTVPALVNIASGQVVYNNYHELTISFETAWKEYHREDAPDLFPDDLATDIRQLNEVIFQTINNGVYKAGFARSQASYEAAYDNVFQQLDIFEERLSKNRYLFGERLTDSDVRLYTTLARFDSAYFTAFHVNHKRIVDYPHLWGYARDLYQTPGFGDTTDFEAIKQHYFLSITLDPNKQKTAILPKGPDISIWQTPHGREALSE